MSLQSQLDNLIYEFSRRKVVSPKLVEKILSDDAHINSRLLERLLVDQDLKLILDELYKEGLVWVDDESKCGDIYMLQKLSLAVDGNQELLLMYDNLMRNLVQDQPRVELKIPQIVAKELKAVLSPLGWIVTRKFFDHLGIVDGDLHALDRSNLDKCIDEALRVYIAQSQGLYRSNEELLLHVIQTLEKVNLLKLARELKSNFSL